MPLTVLSWAVIGVSIGWVVVGRLVLDCALVHYGAPESRMQRRLRLQREGLEEARRILMRAKVPMAVINDIERFTYG